MRAAAEKTLALGTAADRAGIDSLWLLEDPDGWDAFAVLGAIARQTENLRLGTGVVNPYYRHPAQIAASVTTLDWLSGGRAFLGIGRGQTEWYERAIQLDGDQPEAFAFQPADHLADQAAGDAVGLDEDQGAFSHVAQRIDEPRSGGVRDPGAAGWAVPRGPFSPRGRGAAAGARPRRGRTPRPGRRGSRR